MTSEQNKWFYAFGRLFAHYSSFSIFIFTSPGITSSIKDA